MGIPLKIWTKSCRGTIGASFFNTGKLMQFEKYNYVQSVSKRYGLSIVSCHNESNSLLLWQGTIGHIFLKRPMPTDMMDIHASIFLVWFTSACNFHSLLFKKNIIIHKLGMFSKYSLIWNCVTVTFLLIRYIFCTRYPSCSEISIVNIFDSFGKILKWTNWYI